MMNENQLDIDLRVTEKSKQILWDTAKWGNILAITSFVFLVLVLIFTIITNTNFDNADTRFSNDDQAGEIVGSIFAMIIFIFFYGYPTFMLYSYSKKLKNAVGNLDHHSLEEAFVLQKKMYKFIAIATIVFMSLFAFSLLFTFSKFL